MGGVGGEHHHSASNQIEFPQRPDTLFQPLRMGHAIGICEGQGLEPLQSQGAVSRRSRAFLGHDCQPRPPCHDPGHGLGALGGIVVPNDNLKRPLGIALRFERFKAAIEARQIAVVWDDDADHRRRRLWNLLQVLIVRFRQNPSKSQTYRSGPSFAIYRRGAGESIEDSWGRQLFSGANMG